MRLDILAKNIISKSMMALGILMVLSAGSSVDISCDYKRIIACGLVGGVLLFAGRKVWEY